MTGKQLLLKALKDKGVKYIFGYIGGAIMPFFDEMEKLGQFKFIMGRHEQGSAFMAQGLTRASLSTPDPQVGVCVSTSGPGAMNLVTGIADAQMDSVAMVAITGQVATGVIATDAFQESDVVGVMMPICKQTYMPLTAEEIEKTVHEGFYVATTGRGGPVVIDVPKDVQNEAVADSYSFDPASFRPDLPGYFYTPTPEREPVKRAIELINKSERPVMFCGHGVINSNAGELLQKVAEKVNIPVAFTLHGLSAMAADHPLSLGMMGMHGTVEANRAIMEADLLISFGMRFDDRVTGKLNEYAQNADVIHVEIDPSEIDKNVRTSIAINADAYRTLHVMLGDPMLTYKPRRRWLEKIASFRSVMAEDTRRELEYGVGDDGKLLMKTVVHRLSEVTAGKEPGDRRCRPAPDDFGALLQLSDPQQLVCFGRRRDHGLFTAHGHWGQAGPAAGASLVDQRGRRFPDESPGTRHHHGAAAGRQDHHSQQRLSGHGSPVADLLF